MFDKIINSYKNRQLIIDDGGVSIYLTTKAKSKHSISFTFHVYCGGENIRNIHHRLVGSEYVDDEWAYVVEERVPNPKQFRPKKIPKTAKEKKFKEIDEAIFKHGSPIFK